MATLQTAPFTLENAHIEMTSILQFYSIWKQVCGSDKMKCWEWTAVGAPNEPKSPQLVDGLSRIWQALGSNQWTGVSWPQNEPLLDEVMTVDCIVLNLVHSISFWPPSSVSLSLTLSLMSLCRSYSLVFTFSFLAHYICLSLSFSVSLFYAIPLFSHFVL